jgi:3-oxoacyl-[acyl-carrier protein] reductase
MDLSNRAVLIIGGKRIGVSIAVECARKGADVSISYNKSVAEAEQAASLVRESGRRALVTQVNVKAAEDCQKLVDVTVAGLGRLDVLIYMASHYVHKSFDGLNEADWDHAIATDLKGAYLCALAAVPYMRTIGGGRIINFSDWVASSGRPRYLGLLPYYVAKSGVIGLTEGLALELAGDDILVNAIAPGPIRPPENMDDKEIQEVEQATPLGRWGRDQEIVKAILALVESDFITGETIRVDGGRHLK